MKLFQAFTGGGCPGGSGIESLHPVVIVDSLLQMCRIASEMVTGS
jgi:hypothetical protein